MSATEKPGGPTESVLNRGMSRREALSRMAILMGGVIVGAEYFLNGTRVQGKLADPAFSPTDISLMDEIGETIIPATMTPGAKDAQVGAFMAMMVKDGYDDAQQAIFKAGLVQVDSDATKKYGKSFLALSPADRTALLTAAESDRLAYTAKNTTGAAPHYFQLIKQVVILGYFTSEVGCTKALRYIEVPGSFNGNVPYKKGEGAWFVPTRGLF